MADKIVAVPGKNTPYSAAVRAGDFIFVSGQVGHLDENGQPVSGIEAQTKQALANLKKVLEAAGSSLEQVVKVTVFLRNEADVPRMNEVYRACFTQEPPARSTAVAAPPLPAMLVEIDAVACRTGK